MSSTAVLVLLLIVCDFTALSCGFYVLTLCCTLKVLLAKLPNFVKVGLKSFSKRSREKVSRARDLGCWAGVPIKRSDE